MKRVSLALIVLLLVVNGYLAYHGAFTREPALPPLPSDAALAEGRRLRSAGRFDDAANLLRDTWQHTGSVECLHTLLGVLEDTGKADVLVREAHGYVDKHPSDAPARWMLARGLLFQAATDPGNASTAAWIHQADQITDSLEKTGFASPESPGGVPILRMQSAFLRRQWDVADAQAVKALALGTTSGESADVIALRFDLAVRAGHLKHAEALLDRVAAMVGSWQHPVYYQLRTYREDLLEVREALFDRRCTLRDIDRLEAEHRALLKTGLVDPTLQSEADVDQHHAALRSWIQLRDRGDAGGQLALLEKVLDPIPQKPRCFYSEAVVRPFKPTVRRILAGDLCVKLGQRPRARAYYEAALKLHPDDQTIQERLRALDKS